jgi:hypothetical protein
MVISGSILNKQKNYFYQLLNVHGSGSVRQTEMQIAEPFLPQPRASEVEVATGILKRYKSPDVDQIQQNSFKLEGKYSVLRSINL